MQWALHIIATVWVGLTIATTVASEETVLDLTGTWYVLVHYRDADSPDPEFEFWEEKIWVFEQNDARLKWTEYGIVVFHSNRGRFESLTSGRKVRAEGPWYPDTDQLGEITKGLEVNSRGARNKSLRGSAARGYRTSGSMQRDSFSVIGFSETWEVDQLTGDPVFRLTDVMDSGRSDSLDGKASYTTTSKLRSKGKTSAIKGEFDRDGVQQGTFEMLRAGSVSFAKPQRSR